MYSAGDYSAGQRRLNSAPVFAAVRHRERERGAGARHGTECHRDLSAVWMETGVFVFMLNNIAKQTAHAGLDRRIIVQDDAY